VTDANLVLGYLDPAHFLGGRAALDPTAAAAALQGLARQLGVDRVSAAAGVHRVVNTNMAEGIRLVSVRRGVDPRRFALFAFGGAAGLHVAEVARQLDLTRVIVPRVAAVLSAWGMLATDLRFEVSRTHLGDAGRLDGATVKRLFAEMEAEGRARLRACFDGPVRVQRSAEMRYGEQIFEIPVPLDDVDWSQEDPLPEVVERFHRRHEELYTYALRDQEAVLVNARCAVIGVLPALPEEPRRPASAPAGPCGERRIYLGDWLTVPVYDFDALAPGQALQGPAIAESAMTTVLLRPENGAVVTPHGWLDIAVPAREGGLAV
jgi:N-methylhydantoinase A